MKQLDTIYYATNVKDQMIALMANEELNGLNEHEVYGTMLAAAIATDNPTVVHNMECFVREHIDEETIANAKFAATFVDMQGQHKHLFQFGDVIIVQKDDGDYRANIHNPKMKILEKQNEHDHDFLIYFLAALYIENTEYYTNLRDELLAEKRVDPIAINTAIKIAAAIDTIAKVKGNVDKHTTKVLIVDDDNDLLTLVRRILEKTGKMDVITVNNGADAIKIGKLYKPDLVILDVILPGMPGNEVAERFKKDVELKNTKIIFLTALLTKNETEETGKRIGGNMFLAKPIKGNDLLHCVEKTLNEPMTVH